MYPSSTAERLGTLAGLVVTGLLVALLFVGPWRAFALGGTGSIPVESVGDGGNGAFAVGAAGTLLVAFVTGSAYPLRADGDQPATDELVMAVVLVPLVVVIVGTVALFVAPSVGTLLSGTIREALLQALVGLVFAVFVAGAAASLVAVYVGLPVLVGAYTGLVVGRADVPESARAVATSRRSATGIRPTP